jgi:(2Fe-2S) ferredoxin
MAIKTYLLTCGGTGCVASHGGELYEALKKEITEQGAQADAQVVRTGCFGFCEKGPIVKVLPDETFYVCVQPADAKEIVAEHVIKGRPVKRLLYDKSQSHLNTKLEDISFYQKQFRIVLRNCGITIPRRSTNTSPATATPPWPSADGNDTGPGGGRTAQVRPAGPRRRRLPDLDEMEILQGRPERREIRRLQRGRRRSGRLHGPVTIEGDPHSVLEAMAIAGRTIGANRGVIYIRAEYPLAIEHLETALKQAREYGCWARTSSAAASTSTRSCGWAPARSSAARKPPCWPPPWASAACRFRGRRSPPCRACGRSPPSSTTSKPTRTSRSSSSRAATGSRRSARRRARAPRSSR